MMRPIGRIFMALLLGLSTNVPVQAALVADQGAYTGHVFDCLGLLFDSEAHAAQCGGPFGLVPPSDLQENMPPPPHCIVTLLNDPALLSPNWEIRVATPEPCDGCSAMLTDMPEFIHFQTGDRLLMAGC